MSNQTSKEEFLGRGDDSEVWGSPHHHHAIKFCDNPEVGQKEYTLLSHAYKTLERYDPEGILRKRASIVRALDFKIQPNTQQSMMTMERVYPLEKHSQPSPLLLKEKYAIVEQLVNHHPPISVSHTNMDQLCYDHGRLLAIIQLGAMIDGEDFEILLGKESPTTPQYKIFVIDFRNAHDVSEQFHKKEIDDLVATFLKTLQEKKYAFIPPPSLEGFSYFKAGYHDFAQQISQEQNDNFFMQVAEQLFNRLDDEYPQHH